MSKLKICGLRRGRDIDFINKYKIDYIGFVFAESKRKVTPHQAKIFIEGLNPNIKSVGIFVDENINRINEIAEYVGLDIVQLHGEESPEYCKQVKGTIWKAFSVKEDIEDKLKEYKDYAEAFVLDTYVKGEKGGTGKTFNWDLIKGFMNDYNIILAGGLNASNVKKAVEELNPYALDLSSGAEEEGFKSEAKIRDILKALDRL